MPAAAVIPAPVAYIKVVAVKKLVVELLWRGCAQQCARPGHILLRSPLIFTYGCGVQVLYLEKIRVFQAGVA